jgi:hypothetical protein
VLDLKCLSGLGKKSNLSSWNDTSEDFVFGAPSSWYVDGKNVDLPPRSCRIVWHAQISIASFRLAGFGQIPAGKNDSWKDNQVFLVNSMKRSSVMSMTSGETWPISIFSKLNWWRKSTRCCMHNRHNIDQEMVSPHGYSDDIRAATSWIPLSFLFVVVRLVASAS